MKNKKIILLSLVVINFLFAGQIFALQYAGSLVKAPDGTIYFITNQNTKRAYTSWGAFLSFRNNSLANVVNAGSDDLALQSGDFIAPREASIFCSDRSPDKGTCYIISQSRKLGFTSEFVFNCLGYSFNQSFQGDVSFVPAGAVINNCSQAHPIGTAVNLNGVVYLVGADGLYSIPDASTLKSWGYDAADVVTGNSYDDALAKNKTLTSKAPGFIGPFYTTTGSSTFIYPGSGQFSGQTISASQPVINFTVEGQKQVQVKTGQNYSYTWSVSGADSVDSYYSATAADSCGVNPYPGTGSLPWDAYTANGLISRTADSCRAGKTYTITIRAKKSGLNDVTSSVQVTFTQ